LILWAGQSNILINRASAERGREKLTAKGKQSPRVHCVASGFIGAAGQIYANTTHSSNKVANPFGESLYWQPESHPGAKETFTD
jgi:hypothetical protein